MRLPIEETVWSDAAKALKTLEVSARAKGVTTVRAMTRGAEDCPARSREEQ